MISIIITSWNEPKTIYRCISSIGNTEYSRIDNDFEIIQLSPDDETLKEGLKAAHDIKLGNRYIQIKDPKKGKPYALKMAFKIAKGDIIIITDGDTYCDENAIKYLLEPFENKNIGATSGRPISLNSKNNFWGYVSNLLTDAADHRRKSTMSIKNKEYYISDSTFFPVSGYLMAYRNVIGDIPENVLSDDGYISYAIRNKGYKVAYTPLARVNVKFPTSFSDYLKQKVRSMGGFIQIKRMGIMQKDKQSRSLLIELGNTLYALTYARTAKELLYSVGLFPVRLYTWFLISLNQYVLKKGMPKGGWERIESTK